ncbi:uncharacterized protein A4U43_C05F2790 [Asparagus officinalis]|uniref:50S ribosomal protein L18, chloroplastic n=1 Tax=Asparagus officinalis TaxID=4686 RepID=A0A5P1ERE2_ASPOF|nr:uncharacterized protein A4U43_C05F2790 [Asparagus officinalis]
MLASLSPSPAAAPSPSSILSSSKSISNFPFVQRLSTPNPNASSFSNIEAKATTRRDSRTARHQRIRKMVEGTPERPRLCVFRSNKHIYVQVIDDTKMHTLASASTMQKPVSEECSG